MIKIINLITCLSLILLTNNISAEDNSNSVKKAKLRGPAQFQKAIDDYKAYAATVEPEVREEIVIFRKNIAKLNKEKKLLYRKLSQKSQDYLKKEQEYKKKLPLERKKIINVTKLKEKLDARKKVKMPK